MALNMDIAWLTFSSYTKKSLFPEDFKFRYLFVSENEDITVWGYIQSSD